MGRGKVLAVATTVAGMVIGILIVPAGAC